MFVLNAVPDKDRSTLKTSAMGRTEKKTPKTSRVGNRQQQQIRTTPNLQFEDRIRHSLYTRKIRAKSRKCVCVCVPIQK